MMRKLGFCLLVFLLLSVAPAAFAATPAWLSFHEKASVIGPDILLGDIAEVRCDDAQRAAELRALKIGNAAAPGGKVVFSERLLQLRFLSAASQLEDVAWNMEQPITVETRFQHLTGNALVQGVKAFLEREIKRGNELRLYTMEELAVPSDVIAPEGEIHYEYKLPYGIRYAFPSNVNVLVYVNGQMYKKTVVRMKIHVYESVVVANRPLNTKDVIGSGDVRLDSLDVSNLSPGYFTDVDDVVGMVVKRVINSGAALNASLLDKPVVMAHMSMIRIISTVGGIQAQMEGQALQDGREGQWIRVKNVQSGKILSARVIDSTTAEVSAQ